MLSQVVFIGSTLAVTPKLSIGEDDSDLTSRMFNADGSLKQEMETEAKFRAIGFSWDESEGLLLNVDGMNKEGTKRGSSVHISYELPQKWSADELYLDRSEGANTKVCDHITVYQAPGSATMDRLQNAANTGVANALNIISELKELEGADLVSARTRTVRGQKFYDFDMAVAPKTCDSSPENLGLGFCPFESIYLLSSTVLNDRLYVFVINCNKSQWKRANADLKRVRSSFSVAQL